MRAQDPFDHFGRSQHGLITRDQAVAAGVSPGALRRMVNAGRLAGVHPGVYRLAGAPATWAQRVKAATLAGGGGGVASHRSAARLWGIHGDDTVEVTVPSRRNLRLAGVVVHRQEDEPVPFSRLGIPATDPMRSLVDLGAVVDRTQLEDALDRALVRRLVTIAGVERALADLGRRGRDGAGSLRGVLDERALGADRPDGLLEPRMARLLRVHGLPAATFQYEIWHRGRLVARVDFAYPGLRLILEVDGFEVHSSPRALRADLERQNVLTSLGWVVLRFTWDDVVRRPERVAAHIRRALAGLLPAPA